MVGVCMRNRQGVPCDKCGRRGRSGDANGRNCSHMPYGLRNGMPLPIDGRSCMIAVERRFKYGDSCVFYKVELLLVLELC